MPNLSLKIIEILHLGFCVIELKNILIHLLENQNLVPFLSSAARCSPHVFNKNKLQIFILIKYMKTLSIDNWVPHSKMLLYLHHRDSKIFFHPAKLDNFKDEKISDCLSFTKQKLAGLKTGGLVGLWATFEGSFLCFGGQKKFWKIF